MRFDLAFPNRAINLLPMDCNTFIAEVIKALAWPGTILVIAFLLRKPLAALLPTLLRLRYRDLELDFGQKFQALTSGQLPHEERTRRASSLLDSLEPLIGKNLPGGRQIDVSLKVFQGDRLLAEKILTNPPALATNTGESPIDFQKLRIEITADSVGRGPSRKARIKGM